MLLAMLVPQGALALSGNGSSSNPYQITSGGEFYEFYEKTITQPDACAILVNDITLIDYALLIGFSSPYKGTFDGNGKTIHIEGYTFKSSRDWGGLFNRIEDATIKNLNVTGNLNFQCGDAGSVAGYAKGNSQILNVTSSVNMTYEETYAVKHIGGIVGNIEGSTVVKGCTYTGSMNVGKSTDSNGGIVGFANASCSGSITNCFFNGTIKTTSSGPVIGGILGYTNDESKNFGGVQNCYSCGTLSFGSSDYKYANAIVGRIRNRATTTINNTYLSGIATRACNTDGPSIPASNTAITISVTAGANGSVSQSYVNPTSTTATQLQVVATPNTHYHLNQWSDHGAQTHNVGLTANVSLSASFAIDQHTITVQANNANYGTVSGGGTFDYGSTKTITATPKAQHHFVQWNDGDTNASRQITVTEDKTYTATFAPYTYIITVNVASGQSNMGTVEGSGTYDYGTQQTITATPKTGYHFVKWSDNNTNASRTITANGNATYTATFAAHTYGDWITDNAATCTASGTKHRTCKICGATDNVTLDELGHDYTVESDDDAYLAYAASCFTDAVYYHKCSRCGSKGTTTWTKTDTKLGHNLNNISQCTNKGCNYKAKAVYDNSTLTFYFDDLDHSGSTYSLNADKFSPDWRVKQVNEQINITAVVFDASFAAARPTTCFRWFSDCNTITSISGIENLNTEEVKCMSSMFYFCTSLKSLDLSGFNTEKVLDMFQMFYHCAALTSLDLSSFSTTNVTNMKALFGSCIALENLAIGNFDMQLVTDKSFMFYNCNALNTLTLKSLPFLADDTFNTQFSGDGKTVNYELDDNSVIYTGATNYLPAANSVTYMRALTADKTVTFILPFDIPVDNINAMMYKFSDFDGDTLTFSEPADGIARANKPYLLTETVEGNLMKAPVSAVSVRDPQTIKIGNASMVGTYTKQTGLFSTAEESIYGYSGGQFVRQKSKEEGATQGATLNRFRALIKVKGEVGQTLKIQFVDKAGNLTASDVVAIQDIILSDSQSEEELNKYDLNNDDEISVIDLTKLVKYLNAEHANLQTVGAATEGLEFE